MSLLLPERLTALQEGRVETKNFLEVFPLDFPTLLATCLPEVPPAQRAKVAAPLGILKRMRLAGHFCAEVYGVEAIRALAAHPSDTIRGIACFALSAQDPLSFAQKLALLQPFANDPHFAVREWAQLALRPHNAEAIEETILVLTPWAEDPQPFLRRFACEITRPRGVWCAHIQTLRQDPTPALPLLTTLRNDPHPYVQTSLGNWLNDAAKDHAAWVQGLFEEWEKGECPVPPRLRRRALRSLLRRPLLIPPTQPRKSSLEI